MAPTKSAGRVSIRVVPDSTRFRDDLKKTLDRIENTMRVKIQVDPVFDRKQLAELKRQIEALKITIKPDIDLRVPTDEIAKIKEAIESMDPMVEINAKANTAAAAARIRALTRDKMVNIWPILHKTAVNNFTKHLAAISGASFIAKEIEKGMHFLRTIDQHAVQLAKQATLLGGVISLVNGAVQAIMAIGDGLISTIGILSVAPALASSLGIAIAVFVVALKDMKEVLGDLGPAFSELASEMSFAFWDEAADPIREMVNHLMPTLSEKMILASTSMGKLTGQIAKSYKEHVTIEKFAIMFDRVLESMDTVRDAVDPIIEAFTILGMHGTQYLNRLSLSIVKLSEDFRDFLKISEENGNLARWTETAIQAFKDLGGILKGVWNVFGSLNDAMKEAGGPTLASLHANLDNLARMMDSDMFQRSMTAVFRGMNVALANIGQAVKNLGPDLAAIAPVVELSFVTIGDTIAILIGYLGDIISHPAVRGGLLDFFEGINKAVRALSPAIEPFSLALGSLLTLLGTVVENVGELVGTIMQEWGPSLQRLSDVFDTLAEPLRVMLEDVVRELTPAIEILIDRAIIPLLEWIRDHLIPAISQFVEDSGPAIVAAMELLGDTIEGVLPTLTKLTDFFTENEGEMSKFKEVMLDLNQLFNDPASWLNKPRKLPDWDWDEFWKKPISFEPPPDWDGGGDSLNKWIAEFFIAAGEGIADGYMDFSRGVDKAIAKAWEYVTDGSLWDFAKADWKKFVGGLDGMLEDIAKWWDDIWNNFRPAKDNEKLVDWQKQMDEDGLEMATMGIDINLGELKENFARWWGEVSEGWTSFWAGVGINSDTGMAGLGVNLAVWWEEVKTGFAEWWAGITEGFATWWEDVKTGWSEFWTGFGEKFEEAKTGISEGFAEWWEGVKTGFSEWWLGITEGWNEFWAGFGEKFTEAKDGIAAGFDEWWTGIKEGFNTWWEDIKKGWNDFWSGVGETTSKWWTDIKSTITNKINEIKQNLITWIEDQKAKIANGWQHIKDTTAQKWAEIRQAITDKWHEIVNYIPGQLQQFAAHVRNGFESARQAAREKMQELKQAVIDKAQEVIDWVRDLPNKLRNAMSGQSLKSSGQSLMAGFGEGIESMGETLKQKARDILQSIRNMFPSSPAKEGPFSGKGWTPYSGAALIDGFAEGMSSRMSSAVSVARRMHQGVANELNNTKLDKFEPGLGEGSGGNVTVKIYNPIAEPSSRTIARASSMIKLGGKP